MAVFRRGIASLRSVSMVMKTKRRKKSAPVLKRGLKYLGIKEVTRVRYTKQIRLFFDFIKHNGIVTPTTYRDLDCELAAYIDHMYMEGEPIGYAGDLISGMSRFMPGCRPKVPITRSWFRNWQRETVRSRALPIPIKIMKGLSGIALALERYDLAALVAVGFLCMLRTGEIYSLRPMDILFGPKLQSAIIFLSQTKTSGPNTEQTTLEDPCVVRALAKACVGVPDDEPVYTRHSRFFGEELRWLGSLVNFTHKRFTPYSLRRGGATWHAHRFGSLSHTCIIGRWKHEKTAKVYIDGAAAEWASWRISEKNWAKMKQGTELYKEYFSR